MYLRPYPAPKILRECISGRIQLQKFYVKSFPAVDDNFLFLVIPSHPDSCFSENWTDRGSVVGAPLRGATPRTRQISSLQGAWLGNPLLLSLLGSRLGNPLLLWSRLAQTPLSLRLCDFVSLLSFVCLVFVFLGCKSVVFSCVHPPHYILFVPCNRFFMSPLHY